MGWLHDAHGAGRIRLGGSRKQRKGPLRKIISVIRKGGGMFDRDRVILECGHEVKSNAQFKARCPRCLEETRKTVVS